MLSDNDKKMILEKYHASPKGWEVWLRRTKKLSYIIKELKDMYPMLNSIREMLYWLDNNLSSFPKCPVCGNDIKNFINAKKGYFKHCSCSCAQLDDKTREKMAQTNLERYGDPNYNNQEKAKQTCLEKYGVENPFQSEEVKEKIKQTNLEKYGVENSMQNLEIKQKAKNTNLSKYGATTYIHSDLGKIEISNIMLERYGVDHHWKNKEIRQKSYTTIISNYGGMGNSSEILRNRGSETLKRNTGYKHNWSNPDSRERCYNTCLEKYGTRHPVLLHPPHGPSKGQVEVYEFVLSIYNGEVILNDRHLKDKYSKIFELDIYLPKINLAIEYDGDYWHSLKDMKIRDAIKDSLCVENNIKLIRIKESNWIQNKEEIKNKLLKELSKYE